MIPRYYQQESHDAAWDYLRAKSGNPVIVLPTGAGKSLVIAMLIQQAMEYDARVIVLQHRKELIEQNAEKIRILCPGIKIGINSAGLGQRDYDGPVVFAGIQSVYRNAPDFGRRELILIDEAHLVGDSDSSMVWSIPCGSNGHQCYGSHSGIDCHGVSHRRGIDLRTGAAVPNICYESKPER